MMNAPQRARRPALVAGLALAAACAAAPALPAAAASAPARHAAAASAPAERAAASAPAAAKPRVIEWTVTTPDGAAVTVAAFRGPVTFRLHNGSSDPGPLPTLAGVRSGPSVGGGERGHLLAAFNGGFKLIANAGGYEQERKVAQSLRKGFASFIIDASGKARIALWGYGAPARVEKIYSVRQNLGLLVEHGRPTPAAAYWQDWGATVTGTAYVARSAAGMDSSGDILYAASMSAVPEDLALALAEHGARIGMELDINPEWVQLDVASRPGGTLRAAIPGQWRPADQYLVGWTRDFIAVRG